MDVDSDTVILFVDVVKLLEIIGICGSLHCVTFVLLIQCNVLITFKQFLSLFYRVVN